MSASLRRRVQALRRFRALGVSWPEHLAAVRRLEATVDARPRVGPSPDVTVTINSFRRPHNVALLAHLALSVPDVARVIVSQNDPTIDLADHVSIDDPRLTIHASPARHGPVSRYLRAREAGGRWFVSIDDDLFLHPAQLARLIAELKRDPTLPHGVYGQDLDRARGRWRFNLGRSDARVDVLNRVYAFTDAHLARYFELLDRLGLDRPGRLARFTMDDVPLAFVAGQRPVIHDVGPHVDCPSESDREVALFLRPLEADRRVNLFERLEREAPRAIDHGPRARRLRRGLLPRRLPG